MQQFQTGAHAANRGRAGVDGLRTYKDGPLK